MDSSLRPVRVGLKLLARAIAFLAAVSLALPASAETVRGNPGGQIVVFALHVAELRAAAEQVRFEGACDSACTLYLSLPADQLCITARASFGFHLPYGVGAQQNAVAANYLISQYPDCQAVDRCAWRPLARHYPDGCRRGGRSYSPVSRSPRVARVSARPRPSGSVRRMMDVTDRG